MTTRTQTRTRVPLRTKNFQLAHGHRTSLRLEPDFLSALEDICFSTGVTATEFVSAAYTDDYPGSRTSAVRTAILNHYRNAKTRKA